MNTQIVQWHLNKGAQFEDYFGLQIPSHYGNYESEYWRLRKDVAIRDVSFLGKIRVTGADRIRFLHNMLSADIRSLTPGKGVWSLFLDIKGHIQADMKIYAMPDELLIVLQPYLVDKLISGLDKYIIGEDVTMKDVSGELAMFQLIGPSGPAWLRSVDIQQLPEESYSFVTADIKGVSVRVIRLGDIFALLCDADSGVALLDAIQAPPVGQKSFEIFRLESGLPLMHRDMDETNFPQEARIDAALNFKKGCYLGQETMARIDAQGHVNRRLMGFESDSLLAPGDRLFHGDREVGRITSAVHSLLLGKPFALGYVRRELASEGQTLNSGNTTLVVRELPLS